MTIVVLFTTHGNFLISLKLSWHRNENCSKKNLSSSLPINFNSYAGGTSGSWLLCKLLNMMPLFFVWGLHSNGLRSLFFDGLLMIKHTANITASGIASPVPAALPVIGRVQCKIKSLYQRVGGVVPRQHLKFPFTQGWLCSLLKNLLGWRICNSNGFCPAPFIDSECQLHPALDRSAPGISWILGADGFNWFYSGFFTVFLINFV